MFSLVASQGKTTTIPTSDLTCIENMSQQSSQQPTPRDEASAAFDADLRFHLVSSPFKSGANPVREVLDRDDQALFGDEQLPRAQELLRNMRSAVQRSFRDVSDAALLHDGSPVPLCAVQLFSSLCDCIVGSKTSTRKKVLDRRLPLVCFVHEVVSGVYSEHAKKCGENYSSANSESSFAISTDETESAATLLRMISNLADFVTWAFFSDACRAAAKQPSLEFTGSVARTTIMGLRRTSAVEAGQHERNFMAASTRTSVLHESLHEAFAAQSDVSVHKKLMQYYTDPISVPVFDDDEENTVPKGHVELTRWFLTLVSLAEVSEEALCAALLQELDFAAQFLMQAIADRFELLLGVSVRVPKHSKHSSNSNKAPASSSSSSSSSSSQHGALRRVQHADGAAAAKKVVALIHPLSNGFPRVVDAFVELTQLIRPVPNLAAKWREARKERNRARAASQERGYRFDEENDGADLGHDQQEQQQQQLDNDPYGDRSSTTAAVMRRLKRSTSSLSTVETSTTVNWGQNQIVHRLACGIVALLLERLGTTIVDCVGLCALRSDSPARDEELLLRNDIDAHFVKECVTALEATITEELSLDEECLEALLPLRELCDLLALPADCFKNAGVFYSVLPKELVRLIALGHIVESVPSMEPREVHDCSVIDLVSCGDMCHACTTGSGMRVETESELSTIKWDSKNPVASIAAPPAPPLGGSRGSMPRSVGGGGGGAAEKYRTEMDARRVVFAKTFSAIERGIADSLAQQS